MFNKHLFNTYKVLLILGNGFDLSLGLKTSYVNFIESNLFQKRVAIHHYPNARIDIHDKNIHNYLSNQKKLKNWIDVEMELKEYASQQRVEYHNDNGGSINCCRAKALARLTEVSKTLKSNDSASLFLA